MSDEGYTKEMNAILHELDDWKLQSGLEREGRLRAEVQRDAAVRALAVVEDLAQFIKDRIALCQHGTISVTCGPCMAPWLTR